MLSLSKGDVEHSDWTAVQLDVDAIHTLTIGGEKSYGQVVDSVRNN